MLLKDGRGKNEVGWAKTSKRELMENFSKSVYLFGRNDHIHTMLCVLAADDSRHRAYHKFYFFS